MPTCRAIPVEACSGRADDIHGRRRDRGFTLVEVLAAVALLSIGLLAVLTADQAARETQTRAVYMSIGRNIAQTKIEELRATPFGTIPPVAHTTDSSLPNGNDITVKCTPYSAHANAAIARAVVAVSWTEHLGTRTIVYDTLIVRK